MIFWDVLTLALGILGAGGTTAIWKMYTRATRRRKLHAVYKNAIEAVSEQRDSLLLRGELLRYFDRKGPQWSRVLAEAVTLHEEYWTLQQFLANPDQSRLDFSPRQAAYIALDFYDQVFEGLHNTTAWKTRGEAWRGERDKLHEEVRKRFGPRPSADSVIPEAYRQWLLRECGPVLGLGSPARLNQVYVPLTSTRPLVNVSAEEAKSFAKWAGTLPADEWEKAAECPATEARQARDDLPRLLLHWFDGQSLLVDGPPGGGKTTFIKRVAMLCCSQDELSDDREVPEGFREGIPQFAVGGLPVVITLREFRHSLPSDPDRQSMSAEELEQALDAWLRPKGLTWAVVQERLDAGSAILLIDGMDEVPQSAATEKGLRWYPQPKLVTALAEAIPRWTKNGSRVLLTTRPYGLNKEQRTALQDGGSGLVPVQVDDLPTELQDLLVKRVLRILSPNDFEHKTEQMLSELRQLKGLDELRGNPLLLTAMCQIYEAGGRLPQDIRDLYRKMVNGVLEMRFRSWPELIDHLRDRLRYIAYSVHTGERLGVPRDGIETQLSNEDLDKLLVAFNTEHRSTPDELKDPVETRRNYLLARSGLLVPSGDENAAFVHLSFQEHLAGEELLEVAGDDVEEVAKAFDKWRRVRQWHPMLYFAFGKWLSEGRTKQNKCRQLLARLIDIFGDPNETLDLQVVVAHCFEMLARKDISLDDPSKSDAENQPIRDRFRQACRHAVEEMETRFPLTDRFQLAVAWGFLGDERIHDPRDPAGFLEIQAGPYLLGDDRRRWDLSKSFCLAKHPVTNSQFKRFIDDSGYAKREFWIDDDGSEAGWKWRQSNLPEEPHPALWHHSKFNAPNQPVAGVSYWEAKAFAKWAGGRLPTADESEAAARGPEGLVYPWGDEWDSDKDKERCNWHGAGLGITSPVGLFPRSRSRAFELEDMAGNVWEWCADFYDAKKTGPDDRCVLRGGAFFNLAVNVRAASRNHLQPGDRDDSTGFRLART